MLKGQRFATLFSIGTLIGAWWVVELGWVWKMQGGVSSFCWEILDFEYDNGGGIFLTIPLLTYGWVQSCKAVFQQLGPKQRHLLEPLFGTPLDWSVRVPACQLAKAGLAEFPVPAKRHKDLRESLLASPPRHTFPRGFSVEDLTNQVLAYAGGLENDWLSYHKQFEELGQPNMDPMMEPSEVGRALKEGRLARFDATKVLPAKVFNVTLDKLSALHAPNGDGLTILAYLHHSKPCREQAYRTRKLFPVGALFCDEPPTVGEVRRSFPNPAQMPMASRIGLKRLPNYIDEDDMLHALGIEGVERPEGQIIMGHANGDVHWDEQDNIFVQASGVAVVFAVPAQYTDAIFRTEGTSAKSTGKTWHEWMNADEVRRTTIPWYYMVLKPGDAIAIPSRAIHAVYGGHNRASLQTFLEPKFHGMRWPTNKNSYWHIETDVRQAVRNLYFQTLGHLWDTQKIGMVAQGAIIEYL